METLQCGGPLSVDVASLPEVLLGVLLLLVHKALGRKSESDG